MRYLKSIFSGLIGAAVAIAILIVLRSTVFKQPTPSKTPANATRQGHATNIADTNAPVFEQNETKIKSSEKIEISAPSPAQIFPRKHITSQPAKQLTAKPASQHPPLATQPVELTPESQMKAGDRALAEGNIKKALIHFHKAVDLGPDNPEALRGLAMAMLGGKIFDQAIPVYQKLLELVPDDKVAKFNLALALAREAKFLQAEKVYLNLLEQQPDYIEARSNLAMMYQTQAKLKSARRQWLTVIRQAPKYADAHTGLGEVLMDLKNYNGAMYAFAEAVKLQPKNVSARLNMATAAKEAGSGGRALYALRKALELAPKDSEAWTMFGDISLEIYRAKRESDRIIEAVAAWKASLKLDPHQPRLRELIEIYGPTAEKFLKQKEK